MKILDVVETVQRSMYWDMLVQCQDGVRHIPVHVSTAKQLQELLKQEREEEADE